jgi:hypothetical protein
MLPVGIVTKNSKTIYDILYDDHYMDKNKSVMQTDKIDHTLAEWLGQVSRAHQLHYKRELRLDRLHVYFGIAIIILSTIAAALSLAPLGKSDWFGYVAGACSTLALAVASIQTFRHYREEADNHLAAAKKYNALKFELEHVRVVPPDNWNEFMTDFRHRLAAVDQEAPPIPPSYYRSKIDGTT